MAITGAEYFVLRGLRDAGMIPENPAILQFGESNWYGDLPIKFLEDDIEARITDPVEKAELKARLHRAFHVDEDFFEVARICYRVLLGYKSLDSIDATGTERAMKLDLNGPLDLGGRQYDMLFNIGTAEHVFNICQVFKSMHELTRPGGVMVHCAPFHGWVDHGFYTLQPTLFFDLAEANGYSYPPMVYSEIDPPRTFQFSERGQVHELAKSGKIGKNVNLYVIYRKPAEELPFRIPFQGYYSGTLTEEQQEAWQKLR